MLYSQPITDSDLNGGLVRSLRLFGDICGPNFLKNTALMTTMWDDCLDSDQMEDNEDTELELKGVHWRYLIQRGAMYERSYSTTADCNRIINRIIEKIPNLPKLPDRGSGGGGRRLG